MTMLANQVLFYPLAGLVTKPLPKPGFDIDSVNIWQGARRIVGGDLHHGQTRARWIIRFVGKSIKNIIIIDGLTANESTASGNFGKVDTMRGMAFLHTGFAKMPVI